MGKNILVIDNDRILVDDLLRALNGLKYSVKYANTGFKGICMLDDEHFDIVIIDLYALEFDGEDAAKYIRNKSTYGVPMVIGLYENPNSIRNNEFDRSFGSPLSMSDFLEILKYCSIINNNEFLKPGFEQNFYQNFKQTL